MSPMNMLDAGGQEPALRKGRAHYRSLPGTPLREFFVYYPKGQRPERIVVLMHGISENACEQLLRFAPEAEARGVALIAPLMQRSVFGQYQQLLDPKRGVRADEALLDILCTVREETGLSGQPIDIFGFSGGGQFAHRFGLIHPRAVRSCVLVAPGWFTFPDPERAYPRGLAGIPTGEQLFDEAAARSIPFHVIVGDQDIVRDASLRSSKGLDRYQGRNRLERAVRWHRALREWGGDPRSSLTILQGLGHSFAQAVRDHDLPRLVFDLFGRSRSNISNQQGR